MHRNYVTIRAMVNAIYMTKFKCLNLPTTVASVSLPQHSIRLSLSGYQHIDRLVLSSFDGKLCSNAPKCKATALMRHTRNPCYGCVSVFVLGHQSAFGHQWENFDVSLFQIRTARIMKCTRGRGVEVCIRPILMNFVPLWVNSHANVRMQWARFGCLMFSNLSWWWLWPPNWQRWTRADVSAQITETRKDELRI